MFRSVKGKAALDVVFNRIEVLGFKASHAFEASEEEGGILAVGWGTVGGGRDGAEALG